VGDKILLIGNRALFNPKAALSRTHSKTLRARGGPFYLTPFWGDALAFLLVSIQPSWR
jgi:hypothetical protein